jgi:hypothetical protein
MDSKLSLSQCLASRSVLDAKPTSQELSPQIGFIAFYVNATPSARIYSPIAGAKGA